MFYELFLFTASLIGRIISLFDKKTARFFNLRKNEVERVENFFKNNSVNKVIWFHAASAGEFEQAKPLIEYFKTHDNNRTIIASFFSPSGFDSGVKYADIDFCFNLPIDFKKNMKSLLDCINPDIIIHSKYDVWANLTRESENRGVKLALISATLPAKSLRHRFPMRYFFSRVYCSLDRVYAISESDAGRLEKICGRHKNNIAVSGDTRFDRILTVVKSKNNKRIIKKDPNCFYLAAGSTYAVSEKKLLEAMEKLKDEKSIRIIIAPHEVDHANIDCLEEQIKKHEFHPVRLSRLKSNSRIELDSRQILIVDIFGILALLYEEADIVFVGGSFKGNVHSVLEPAVFGKPVLTGPYIHNSYEAIKMSEAGALSVCKNVNELAMEIKKIINDAEYRKNMAKKSAAFFSCNTGAAEKIIMDLNNII